MNSTTIATAARDLIAPKYRKAIYAVFLTVAAAVWVLGELGVTAVYGVTVASLVALVAKAAPFVGVLAAVNTGTPDVVPVDPEVADHDGDLVEAEYADLPAALVEVEDYEGRHRAEV